jgi:hypothetical protein
MASSIFHDVWRRRAGTSGEYAPETLEDASNVAIALAKLGHHEAASAMNEKLHRQYERTLGAAHPLTETAHDRLAKNLQALGRQH